MADKRGQIKNMAEGGEKEAIKAIGK